MRIYPRGKRGIYWIEFRHGGQRYQGTLDTPVWEDARKAAAEIHRRVLAGGPFRLEQKAVPLALDLLREHVEDLQRRGRSRKHWTMVRSYLAGVINDSGAVTIEDLTPEALARGLAFLGDRSPRTQNKVLGMAGTWLRWLNKTGRWDKNPAIRLDPVKATKTRTERRALTADELERLTECEFIPACRRLLYLVAAYTGLRRSELNGLRWGMVDLDEAMIHLPAEITKNGKPATVAVPRSVAERWGEWDGTVVLAADLAEWPDPLPAAPGMRTFRGDLHEAQIEEKTDQGLVDFHALRVTFASMLARANVGLALAQKLMRHSTPVLTANTYTRFVPEDARAAVELIAPAPRLQQNEQPDKNAYNTRANQRKGA